MPETHKTSRINADFTGTSAKAKMRFYMNIYL